VPTPTPTPAPTPPPDPDAIFQSGFESGTFAGWTSTVGGGQLAVTSAAALAGVYGMAATLTGTTAPVYVTDGTPANETSYHGRFYFNPNTMTTGGNAVGIFQGRSPTGGTIFRVDYRRASGGEAQLRAAVLSRGALAYTSWYAIPAGAATAIEVAWQSSSMATFSLSTGGVIQESLRELDTHTSTADAVWLGPSTGLGSGRTGTAYFDAFVSTRTKTIGK
jgi:hypothetical protein